MIIKNLWRRKTRTLLTAIGIAVGVAAVVVLSAFGEGMANGFGSVSASAQADLVVGQKDALLIMMGAIDEQLEAEIAQIRGVGQVAGAVVGIVQTPETPYFLVMGEDPRSFALARYRLIAGQPHETAACIGATVASFVIEKWGCQTNLPSLAQVAERFEANFGRKLSL